MTQTTYVPGTVITSPWLNDVDQLRYGTTAATGAALLPFVSPLTGPATRTQSAKNAEYRSTTDLAGGQNAAATLGGGTYHIPVGSYVTTTGMVVDQSSFSYPDYFTPSPRVSILGEAMANVFLYWNGTAGTYQLTLTGPVDFTHVGLWSASEYGNFSIVEQGHLRTRNGISATNLSDMKFRDITFGYLNIGMYLNSCLSSKLDNVKFRNNNIGMVLDNTTGITETNAISFSDCDWTGNTNQGIIANVQGATNRYASCRIEANGVQGQATNGGSFYNIRTDNGPASLVFESCYYEGNGGGADVFLTNTGANNASVVFINCEFDRVSNAQFVTTNVGGSNTGGAELHITFIGCSFLSAGTYVPSTSRPFFSAGDGKVLFIDGGGNTYSENTSRVAAFYNGGVRVNGSTGAILTGAACFSCVRNSAGNYTITSSVPFAPTTNDFTPQVTALTASALTARAVVTSSTTVTVITAAMTTGTATDCDFSFNFIALK